MVAQPRPRAFVVPAAPANGYGTVQSLHREGVPVVALDHRPAPLRHSRYCEARTIPDPDVDERGFVDELHRLASREAMPPVLVATQDLHVHVVHRHAARLAPVLRFPFMDPDGVIASIDKHVMAREAEACGLAVPETWFPRDVSELEDLLPRLARYPYLVKPVAKFELRAPGGYRNFAFFTRFGAKALRAETPGALRDRFAEAAGEGFSLLVQEEIPGPASNLVAVDFHADARHELLAWHTGRKLRQWPEDHGTCTLGRSESLPGLAELAGRFVRRIGFRGIGNIEFKVHGDVPWFVEINPRPWMWIGMASRAGVNLPAGLYRELTGDPSPVRATQGRPGDWIDLKMDLLHLRRLGWGEWMRSVARARADARFSLRDPLVPVGALAGAVWRRLPGLVGHGALSFPDSPEPGPSKPEITP